MYGEPREEGVNSREQLVEARAVRAGLLEEFNALLLKESPEIAISGKGAHHEQNGSRALFPYDARQMRRVDTVVDRHHKVQSDELGVYFAKGQKPGVRVWGFRNAPATLFESEAQHVSHY
jgi:hypothetical protein